MKFNFCFFIFFSLNFIFLVGTLVSLSLVNAQEAPKYNFGSMQAASQFSLKPGQEIETKLYFYNIYGNRPTHIKLSLVEKPKNWQVTIEPDVKSKEYEVSGQIVTVEENLVVYPSNASEEPGENIEEVEWISSKVGYIGANFVKIRIKVPESEEVGRTEKIKINAVAFWLGQTGSISLQQERDFEYTIKTTTEYYEKPLEQTSQKIEKKITSFISLPDNIQPIYMILTGITLILVIVFMVLLVMSKREVKRRQNRKRK